ncbi:hypothetical protein IB229_14070 [Pseudomonas sp. PDM14]|uniref:PSPA7_2676 family Cys-rich small protein n=1 Tax=Pseudomonas sp. PDM14 TaxID=2769288 RepID=UPI00177FBB4E|nr:hypothetical protein [Pseudomonas sp. PDM14]
MKPVLTAHAEEGVMTFLCLINGCIWAHAMQVHFGNEDLLCQSCSRCGASRYLPGNVLEGKVGKAS